MDPHKCIFSIFTIQDTINSVSHKIIRQDIYHIFPRDPVNNENLIHVFNNNKDISMRFNTKWLRVMDTIFILLKHQGVHAKLFIFSASSSTFLPTLRLTNLTFSQSCSIYSPSTSTPIESTITAYNFSCKDHTIPFHPLDSGRAYLFHHQSCS